MNISLDLDEIIVDIMNPYLKMVKQITGYEFKRTGIIEYDITKCTNELGQKVTQEQSIGILHNLIIHKHCVDAPLIKGAKELCDTLKDQGYGLIINTLRHSDDKSLTQSIIEQTYDWISENFGKNYFHAIEFTTGNRTKKGICDEHNCIAHIDDSFKQITFVNEKQDLLPILLTVPHNEKEEKDARGKDIVVYKDLDRIISLYVELNSYKREQNKYPIIRIHELKVIDVILRELKKAKEDFEKIKKIFNS